MRKTAVLTSLLFLFGLNAFAQKQKVVGTWNGELEIGAIHLRLAFNIIDTADGLVATMDSPDQGAYDIPMDKVELTGDTIKIYTTPLAGEYVGVIDEEGKTMKGTWSQGGMDFALNMEKGEKIVLNRPQEPKPPFPYLIEDVSYPNDSAGITLAGTLTYPKGEGPFPTVLMLTGSGIQDRDESLLGHKPFWVIADYLTRNGIAVLRVDDRGAGQSTGNPITATIDDFVSDARAGVNYLKSRDIVGKIGLIGHSEGGVVAPILASESNDIAFIIMLAGPGLKGDTLLAAQLRAISAAEGRDEEYINSRLSLQKAIFDVIRKEKDSAKAAGMLTTVIDDWKVTLPDTVRAEIDSMGIGFYKLVNNQSNNNWLRRFIDYDPAPTLMKVKCPVLEMIGSKDLQVPPDINLPIVKQALADGGNENYMVLKVCNLNHLFQNCETGQVSEYGQIEETFAPEALYIMSGWINDILR